VTNRLPRLRCAGLTVIELLVGLAIAAALIAIAVPVYRGAVERARVSRAVSDIAEISMSLTRAHTVLGRWPNSLAEVAVGDRLDPWGRPYRYLAIDVVPPPRTGQVRRDRNLNPLNRDFDLYSVGPDGDTQAQLTGQRARDDIVRAANGGFIGRAEDH
jgi:general secretion pathway protein G